MVGKYRTRWQIAYEILQTIHGGKTRRTQIMYNCSLSYPQLVEYLGHLIKKGLIKEIQDRNGRLKNYYVVTESGRHFVMSYLTLEKMMMIKA